MPKVEYSFTDDSALWQARNGNSESAATKAAWDYLESRLQGCDPALANSRIDDENRRPPVVTVTPHEGVKGAWVFPDQKDYVSF